MVRRMLVGGAWKMYKGLDESIDYANRLNDFCLKNIRSDDNIEVFLLPTYLPLYHMKDIVTSAKLKYGAQNCCWEDEGAFTGEVSPAHLKDAGCTYVELGHAERRSIFSEDDLMINKKENHGAWPDPRSYKKSFRLEFSIYVSLVIIALMVLTGYIITDKFVKRVTSNEVEKLLVQARSFSSSAGL